MKTAKFAIVVSLIACLLTTTPINVFAGIQSFYIAWDPNPPEENVTGYTGIMTSTFQSARSQDQFDVNTLDWFDTAALTEQFSYDDNINGCVYMTVAAYNDQGFRSDSSEVLCYIAEDMAGSTSFVAPNCSTVRVDGQDLTFLGIHFGEIVDAENSKADLVQDGIINGLDLTKLGLAFGKACPL